MPTTSTELARLLLEWQEQRRLGKPVTAGQLCADAPDLIEELKQQIAVVEAMERRVGMTLTFDGTPSTQSRDQLTGSFDSDRTRSTQPVAPQSNRLAPPGYEIISELGRGGMGVVYKALQVKAKRIVALKMILSGGHASQRDLERFRIEGESVARLQHINIVQVFDVGDHDGKPYFALEFCEGGNLATSLAGTPLQARDAAKLVEKLARAIAEAHAKGIIHRDLKPANVLLTFSGEPKVTDFGLAKQLHQEPPSLPSPRSGGRVNTAAANASSTLPPALRGEGRVGGASVGSSDAELTATGAVMGTPSYMAPEQASGDTKRIGPPCDIYALGAILYECLTGRPPFKGASLVETLDQVRNQEPVPPSQLNPKVPRDLETICLKCLRKEPEKRYTGAAELADDVRRYLDGKPIVARAVGRGERAVKWVKRNPVLSGATAAVFLALAVGAGVSIAFGVEANKQAEEAKRKQKDADDATEREKGETARANRETQDAINARDAEGRAKRAAQAQTARAEGLLLATRLQQTLDATNAGNIRLAADLLNDCQWDRRDWEYGHLWTRITAPQSFQIKGMPTSLCFSTDGSTLVATSGEVVRAWHLETGAESILPVAPGEGLISLFPGTEKHELIGVRLDLCVQRWNLRMGQISATTTGNPADYKRHLISHVCLSPDHKFIAYAPSVNTVSNSQYIQNVKLWDVEKDKFAKTLTRHTNAINALKFSPRGTHIATASSDKTVKIWDLKAEEEATVDLGGERCSKIWFTPDGTGLLALTYPDDKAALKLWDIAEKKVARTIPLEGAQVHELDITADGKTFATGEQDGSVRLWDFATGKQRWTYFGHLSTAHRVCFSQNGKRLATADYRGVVNVWNVERNPAVPQLSVPLAPGQKFRAAVHAAAFSPDGRTFVAGDLDGRFHLWDAESRTRIKTLSTRLPGDQYLGRVWDVAYTPDGTQFATCGYEVKLWDAKTGALVRAFHGPKSVIFRLVFSPDGKRIYAAPTGHGPTSERGPADIWVWEVQTGNLLTRFTVEQKKKEDQAEQTDSLAFSPDGQLVTGTIGASGGTIKFWNAADNTLLRTLTGHRGRVLSMVFNRDGSHMASSCTGDELIIWDVRTGKPLHKARMRGGQLDSLRFSPDGKRLFAGCSDGSVRVWDPELFQEMLTLPGHDKGEVRALALSPDGKRLVSGGKDGSIRIWESLRTPDYADLKGHRMPVTKIAFAPDSSCVFAWDKAGVLLAWSLRDGSPAEPHGEPSEGAEGIVTSPDGRFRAEPFDALAYGNVAVRVRFLHPK